MTPQERALVRASNLRRKNKATEAVSDHPDKVMSLHQWCALNGFSMQTARRMIREGEGPPLVQLTSRKRGVRESDNRAWQASRMLPGRGA